MTFFQIMIVVGISAVISHVVCKLHEFGRLREKRRERKYAILAKRAARRNRSPEPQPAEWFERFEKPSDSETRVH